MAKRLSKHERRKLKLQKRKEQRKKGVEETKRKEKTKKILSYLLISIISISIIYGLFSMISKDNDDLIDDGIVYSQQPIHWHADLEMMFCGVNRDLPRAPAGSGMLGPHILHTHDDNKIHIEGLVRNSRDITLGKFFDGIKVKFTNESIFEYKNGNMCNDSEENTLKMFVNGEENFKFRDHVLKDGDRILIEYN